MDQKSHRLNAKVTAHQPKPSAGTPNGWITGGMVVFRVMSVRERERERDRALHSNG